MAQAPSIDRLLNLAADSPDAVLTQLREHPDLASKQDGHGYSLVHAAASYGHQELLSSLVKHFKVDPNIKDEDDETALFSVEEVSMAKLLLELGTDMSLRNSEGHTAAEKLADEDEQPDVARYLSEEASGLRGPADAGTTRGEATPSSSDAHHSHPPPPLPEGVKINVGTMGAEDAGPEPDPEFRRRIEELAARADFEGEDGQRELRDLISDAVTGLAGAGQGPGSRQRRA